VEITGPLNKSSESESALEQIKKHVERSTKGTHEELVGDMLVWSYNLSLKLVFVVN
jgi:hypothetical protein